MGHKDPNLCIQRNLFASLSRSSILITETVCVNLCLGHKLMRVDCEKTELVVARYDEDIDWLKQLPNIKISVYDKGEGESNRLPNIGRESHTYIHHIIKNYDVMNDWTLFSQADPFDHCLNFLDIFTQETEVKIQTEKFFGISDKSSVIEILPGSCESLYSIFRILGLKTPTRLHYTCGSLMLVSSKAIRRISLEQYKQLLELHEKFHLAPWMFELCWPSIFGRRATYL